jgi:BirA family biotin operon repressor/biotin-[acetyl-CoA-carboxylase] ligase
MIEPLFDPASPNVLIYDKLDSTSTEAKKIIQSGYAEHGMIIWAKEQSKSYGRYGRNWQSLPGNLSFSFIVNSQLLDNQLTSYPFIAALAIKDALSTCLNAAQQQELQFKWPNDILFRGKKVAGVIFESELKGAKINHIICGIGINIVAAPDNIEFATSFKDHKINNIALDKIVCETMSNFDKYINLLSKYNEEFIYKKWLESAAHIGKKLIVLSGDKEVEGVFLGIKKGSLILQSDSGSEHSIATGDVFFSQSEKITTLLHKVSNNITFLNPKQARM